MRLTAKVTGTENGASLRVQCMQIKLHISSPEVNLIGAQMIATSLTLLSLHRTIKRDKLSRLKISSLWKEHHPTNSLKITEMNARTTASKCITVKAMIAGMAKTTLKVGKQSRLSDLSTKLEGTLDQTIVVTMSAKEVFQITIAAKVTITVAALGTLIVISLDTMTRQNIRDTVGEAKASIEANMEEVVVCKTIITAMIATTTTVDQMIATAAVEVTHIVAVEMTITRVITEVAVVLIGSIINRDDRLLTVADQGQGHLPLLSVTSQGMNKTSNPKAISSRLLIGEIVTVTSKIEKALAVTLAAAVTIRLMIQVTKSLALVLSKVILEIMPILVPILRLTISTLRQRISGSLRATTTTLIILSTWEDAPLEVVVKVLGLGQVQVITKAAIQIVVAEVITSKDLTAIDHQMAIRGVQVEVQEAIETKEMMGLSK